MFVVVAFLLPLCSLNAANACSCFFRECVVQHRVKHVQRTCFCEAVPYAAPATAVSGCPTPVRHTQRQKVVRQAHAAGHRLCTVHHGRAPGAKRCTLASRCLRVSSALHANLFVLQCEPGAVSVHSCVGRLICQSVSSLVSQFVSLLVCASCMPVSVCFCACDGVVRSPDPVRVLHLRRIQSAVRVYSGLRRW